MNSNFLIKKKWLRKIPVSSNYRKQYNTSVFFKRTAIRHTILNWDLLYFYLCYHLNILTQICITNTSTCLITTDSKALENILRYTAIKISNIYLYSKNLILVLTKIEKKILYNFVNNQNLLEVLAIIRYIFIKSRLKFLKFCNIQKKKLNFFFVKCSKSWKIIFIYILTILVFYFFHNYIYGIPFINNANNLLIYPFFAFFCLQKKEKEIFFNKLAILDHFFLSKYLEYITNFNNDSFNAKFLKRNIFFILKDWIFYMCFIFISIRFLQFYHSFCILSIKKKETKNKKEMII